MSREEAVYADYLTPIYNFCHLFWRTNAHQFIPNHGKAGVQRSACD